MHHLLPVHLIITMSFYDPNFGTLPAKDVHAGAVNEYWNQNAEQNFGGHQNNHQIQQNKNNRERNASAFAELFEDLHKYIQQEQSSKGPSVNDAEYSQDLTSVYQNTYCEYNTFTPVQNIVQFPSDIPVQATYPQILTHNSGVVHRAHISLIPTSRGTLKTITKRKRKRTIFTTEQVEELEKYFTKKPYVTREDRQILVKQLDINDKAVKIWFQNRRLKGKRDQCHSPLSDNVMMETSLPEFHLDYIQSQINEKTDNFGYVTLDDGLMDNLGKVIDNYLRNSNDNTLIEDTSLRCESSPIYEPISPPDSTKEDEENLHCQQLELTESLQTLLSLQSY